MTVTLPELISMLARHHAWTPGQVHPDGSVDARVLCWSCREVWPCDAARLGAALKEVFNAAVRP